MTSQTPYSVDDGEMLQWAREAVARRAPLSIRNIARITEETTEILPNPFTPLHRNQFTRKNRAQEGIVPAVTLMCDTVSASKNKCGYGPFISSGSPYRTVARASCGGSVVYSNSTTVNKRFLTRDATYTGCATGCVGTITFRKEEDPATCTDSVTSCSGSVGSDPRCACAGLNENSCPCFQDSAGFPIFNLSISDEYTTAALKTNTIAALPAFDGDYDDTCQAVYNLATNELSFTLQRFKYKFHFSSPACAGLVLTWNEHFQPTSGAPTDTPKMWTAVGGETDTSVYTCPDPTVNGATTITDIVVDISGCP